MRTKTLLLTAALAAAGALSSMAQSNVYSLNIVGYVNVTLTNGFNMIANPLDADGTGVNNTLNSAFAGSNLPDNMEVFKFSGGQFGNASFSAGGSFFPNQPLNPGEGCFILNPYSTNITATFVGTALVGSQNNAYPAGFAIISSKTPLSGGVATSLSLTNGSDNDEIFTWNPISQSYGNASFFVSAASGGPAWFPEPSINVGQAFFLSSQSSGNWTQNFTPQ